MAKNLTDLFACGTYGHRRAEHQWHGNITDPDMVSVCEDDSADDPCACAHFVDQRDTQP